MKRTAFSCLFLLSLLTVSQGEAAEKAHTFDAGLETSYYRFNQPRFEIKEDGVLYGVYMFYTFIPQGKTWSDRAVNSFMIDMHADYGELTYKESGDVSGVRNTLVEPRILFGHTFHSNNNSITPYCGVGYRFFMREGKQGEDFADDTYQFIYFPLGISSEKILDNGWKLGGVFEVDILLRGYYNLASHEWNNDEESYSDTSAQYKSGRGVRAAVVLGKEYTNIDVKISPYIRYWDIGVSNTTTYYLNDVPYHYQDAKFTAMEVGLSIGVQF